MLLFELINSFYCICDIFQRIQLKDKTLRRTLTKTTLDHLARNNMARKVDHFNGVQCVSSTTNDPFSEKQSYQMMTEKGERGGRGPQTRRDCSGELLL